MSDESTSSVTTNVQENTDYKCPQCGAEQAQGQAFCPYCGTKNERSNTENVSEVISQFNEGVVNQEKKKRKKTKIIVGVIVTLIILIAVFLGIYVFFNNKANVVINEIVSSTPSTTVVKSAYDELTPIGQFLFRDKIVDTFVQEVSENVYTTSSTWLVNEAALDKYYIYKSIGSDLKISAEDGTNVMSHIEAVLKLQNYEKYNDVRRCAANSVSDYTDCLEYLADVLDSSNYYLMTIYVGYAHTAADDALTAAKVYSSDDSLCVRYIDALETIEEELGDLYYDDGYFSSTSLSTAMDEINEIVKELSDVEDEVKNIVSNIPKIK